MKKYSIDKSYNLEKSFVKLYIELYTENDQHI